MFHLGKKIFLVLFVSQMIIAPLWGHVPENNQLSDQIQHNEVTALEKTQSEPEMPVEAVLAVQAKLLEELDSIKVLFQQIAHLANSGVIKQASSQALSEWASYHTKLIQQYYTHLQNSQLTFELVKQALFINEALMNYIEQIVNQKFIDLTPFNFEQILQRSPLITLEEEDLGEYFAKNNHQLKHLQKTMHYVGVSFTNRFFRTVDGVLNFPLVSPTLKLLVASGAGYYAYQSLSPEQIEALKLFIAHAFDNFKSSMPHVVGQYCAEISRQPLNFVVGAILAKALAGYSFAKAGTSKLYNHLKGEIKPFDKDARHIIEDITLEDPRLIGLDRQKEALYRNIISPLLSPEIFLQTGIELERAVALIGPSRNGKTLIARALCGTINALFKQAGRTDRIGFREVTHLELSVRRLRDIIKEAQQNGPMVIFIDEIHLRRTQTTTGGSDLVEYLTELAMLYETNDPNKMVFLIVATNRPDLMDPALFQHKRFGLVIRFEKPNHTQREQFFIEKSTQLAVDLSKEEIESLVAQTTNCSYGDLDQIFQEAKIAARFVGQSIKKDHLQDVINKLIHRINVKATGQEGTATFAAHYAGHVLAHKLLAINTRIELVTTHAIDRKIKEKHDWITNEHGERSNPNNDKVYKPRYGKMITYNQHESLQITSVEDTLKTAKNLLAGAVAEEILLGSRSLTYHVNDRKKAFEMIKVCLLKGLEEKDLPKQEQNALRTNALKKIQELEDEVRALLSKNKDKLNVIYNALVEKQILLHDEIEKLLA